MAGQGRSQSGSLPGILAADVTSNALLQRLPGEGDLSLAMIDAFVIGAVRSRISLAHILNDALLQGCVGGRIVSAVLNALVISPRLEAICKA